MQCARQLLTAASAGALVVVATVPVQAEANKRIALWRMNESATATVMIDSSANHLDGTIGDEVRTGLRINGGTGYGFPYLRPNTPPAHPEHLVKVPDDPRLDPGTRDFAITMRLRTTEAFGNIIQKGQSRSPGGYFKWQLPKGVVKCLFRGSAGTVTAGSVTPINDGQWHTVRCERTATAVTMTVDGEVTRRKSGATGNIANSKPLSIGGKVACDQVDVTCDYWVGRIDWVKIQASAPS